MCVAQTFRCSCGAREVNLHFKDNILNREVVGMIYCPVCSEKAEFDRETMISDNGWIIVYNMDIAGFQGSRYINHPISPDMIFDEGYCTWNGIYPGDHIDSAAERAELVSIAKTDPKAYIKKISSWATERMKRLANEGWRKAREGAADNAPSQYQGV